MDRHTSSNRWWVTFVVMYVIGMYGMFPKMKQKQAFWAVWSAKVLILSRLMKTMEQ